MINFRECVRQFIEHSTWEQFWQAMDTQKNIYKDIDDNEDLSERETPLR